MALPGYCSSYRAAYLADILMYNVHTYAAAEYSVTSLLVEMGRKTMLYASRSEICHHFADKTLFKGF